MMPEDTFVRKDRGHAIHYYYDAATTYVTARLRHDRRLRMTLEANTFSLINEGRHIYGASFVRSSASPRARRFSFWPEEASRGKDAITANDAFFSGRVASGLHYLGALSPLAWPLSRPHTGDIGRAIRCFPWRRPRRDALPNI